MSRVFYTKFPDLSYGIKNKAGDPIKISGSVAKLLMLAISDSCDDEGDNSYNSLERLILKTDLNIRTIQRVIKSLVINEYIFYEGLSNLGTNKYKINLDKLNDIPKRKTSGRPSNIGMGMVLNPNGVVLNPEGDGVKPPDSSLSFQESFTEEKKELSTHAKKGDPMDLEKYNQRTKDIVDSWLSGQHKDYAHRFPERIVPVTEKMETLWNFVPPQKKSKQYGFWIQSCDDLIEACGEFGISVLDDLHRDWMSYLNSHSNIPPFSVSGPQSLVKSVLAKAAMLRGGNKAPLWGTNGRSERKTTLDV